MFLYRGFIVHAENSDTQVTAAEDLPRLYEEEKKVGADNIQMYEVWVPRENDHPGSLDMEASATLLLRGAFFSNGWIEDKSISFITRVKETRKLLSKRLSFRPSVVHGWGVFADEPIQKNEIIEQTPSIPILPVGTSALLKYRFRYPPHSNTGSSVATGGYSMFYNHSESPNAHYVSADDGVFTFAATEDIEQDQEIFINYGDRYTWGSQEDAVQDRIREAMCLVLEEQDEVSLRGNQVDQIANIVADALYEFGW